MTTKEINTIKEFIEAYINKALDKGESSDEGLISSSDLSRAEKNLDNLGTE